jgi:hypothetical protein
MDTSSPVVIPELPPVPVTPAEGLSLLRDLVISLWVEWGADPEDYVVQFMSILSDVVKKPLLKFDEGAGEFVKQLNAHINTNWMHDYWRIFQLTFFTELGNDRERILDEFVRMVNRVMSEATDDDKLIIKAIQPSPGNVPGVAPEWLKGVRTNLGQLVLLAVKIYVQSVRVTTIPNEGKEGSK